MHGITIFKLVVIIVALALFAGLSVNYMLTSYNEYIDYYSAIMADKEYKKYIESLPLSFDGISVELNAGQQYYATGNAWPNKDDFTVIAHFSEKGKEADRILNADEYDIKIPSDFSINGGNLSFAYTYQPEAADDAEAPAAITKIVNVNVSLVPIAITEVSVKSNPYRIYYSDAMKFEPDGMTLKAKFNYGEEVVIDSSELEVVNGGVLNADTQSAKVAYTYNGNVFEVDIPITVKKTSEYDEGEIVSIKAEGAVYIAEGDNLSNAKPTIRATYSSGNRLIIDSSNYTVSSNLEKAYFYNNCIINVSLNSNSNISCKTAATVRVVSEAESATLNGGTKSVVDEYNADGEKIGTATVVKGITNGNSITFSIRSNADVKGEAWIRLANSSNMPINLSEIMTLKVNGKMIPVPANVQLAQSPIDEYVFVDFKLPDFVLKSGENVVDIFFSNMTGVNIAVDSLNIATSYKGVVSSGVEDYLISAFESGIAPEFDVEMVKDFHSVTNGTYVHGMCTDGTYIYVTRTIAEDLRHIVVSKYDAVTYNLIASSAQSPAGSLEANAGVVCYDGKVIIFFADGTEWCIDPSLSGEWSEYTGFTFEDMDGVALRDVYYDILNDRFAVFAGSSISVFDGDMQAVCSFNIGSEKGLNVARMSATFDYIYVSFNKDGVYNPTVQIYTWSGEYVGRFVVSSGADVVGSFDLAKTNIQGFTMLNNSLYFVQIRWTGTYGAAFLKVDIPEIETTLKYTLSIGESVAASADNATESNVVATPAFGSNGRVETGGSYAMGGVSDGEYLYLSVNGLKNRTTVISKVDPKTNKIVGKTVTFVPTDIAGDSTLGDNSKIFIKGDMLYCILLDGSMVSINTKNFSGENCDVYEADLSFAEYGTAISATWNDSVGKFAVLTNNKKLHIINEDTGAYVRDIALSNGSDAPSSVTADEKFIYVSYKQSSSVPVDVYTWDGIKVGSFVISGFDMGKDVNFNVQAIFFHRGQMHATVCSWTSGYYAYFDWIVEIK